MSLDWMRSSREQRKALYRYTMRGRAQSQLSWDAFFEGVLPRPVAPLYEDNFRSGDIGRLNAGFCYQWLVEHYPDLARQLDADLETDDDRIADHSGWSRFIDTHAHRDGIDIVSLEKATVGVVAFAQIEPMASRSFRRGEPFCFRIDSPRAGSALALQQARGRWLPLPLSRTALTCQVTAGSQIVPFDHAKGTPLPLSEDTEVGRHRFVFIVAEPGVFPPLVARMTGDIIPDHALDAIAEAIMALPMDTWRMYRIAALFTD